MQIDSNIYNALSQPRKSAFDYADEFTNRRMARETNALQLNAMRQQAADDEAIRGLYASGVDVSTPEGLQKLYAISPKAGAAAAQQQAALQKDRNAAALSQTQQQAAQFKLTKEKAEHGITTVLRQNSAEAIKQAVQQGVMQGLYGMQEAQQILSDLPTDGDPQKLQQWRMQQLFGLMSAKEQFEAEDRNRNFDLRANNELIGPDGKVNQPLLGAKASVAAAGASRISVGGNTIPDKLVKQQDDLIEKITTAKATQVDLEAVEKQIDSGKLSFGPVSNLINTGRNVAGLSNEESRNFASFKSTLEKLRNDSLRLNAGVQTDGDAQRAWNELFQNINDSAFVKQRLAEIKKLNQRAADLHSYRLNVLRSNSNAGPLALPEIDPAVGGGEPAAQSGKVRRFNPATGRIE